MNIPITNAVQAAIYFTESTGYNVLDFCWACDIIEREITETDRTRGCPQLAAAARILADEVVRLQKEPTYPFVSHCCQKQPITTGKAGSTCWWECSSCQKPCRIVFSNDNPQPQ